MVSCICLTFGRPWLLEEAMESFLRQDYQGDAELVIFNDFPEQRLAYRGDPRVRLTNCEKRFGSLGTKRNAAIGAARGDVLLTWDDDDVSLPGRISRAVAALGGRRKFFRPAWSWLSLNDAAPELVHRRISWPQIAFKRSIFDRARGYPRASGCEDRKFAERVAATGCPVAFSRGGPEDATFLYRMWAGNPHATGISLGKFGYAELQRRVERVAPRGRIVLEPTWRHDYAALCVPAQPACLKA